MGGGAWIQARGGEEESVIGGSLDVGQWEVEIGVVRPGRSPWDDVMSESPAPTNEPALQALGGLAFRVAVAFLVVTTLLGALLRFLAVWPVPGWEYGHLLHTHSHLGFLGWVFNAFFALAVMRFVPAEQGRFFRRVFLVLQVAVLGMLFSYPIQGYGAVSIIFSTLHMGASAVFAWKLWFFNTAAPAARGHLRVALVFLVASGLGPLALGPLAASGLRDTPAYSLSIYFYLHGQYNGWFVFFLQAVLFQEMAGSGLGVDGRAARNALGWLGVGAVLTLAQSTLWLQPPLWVHAVAALGGVTQLVGCVWLVLAVRGAGALFAGPARALMAFALVALLAKHLLQMVAAAPAFAGLANHRFVVIAFLHLVFLGVVAPALFAWGLRFGWLRDGRALRVGAGVFLLGALATELLLVGPALGLFLPAGLSTWFLLAACTMAAGALGVGRASLEGR